MSRFLLALVLASAALASAGCHVIFPVEGRVRSACTTDAQCDDGLCLSEEITGFPGGACTSGCLTDAECGGGRAVCSNNGFCDVTCDTPADCPRSSVHACYFGSCFSRCFDDGDCSDGRVCNALSGQCVDRVEGLPNGTPCTDDEQCESDICRENVCASLCTLGGPDVCPAGQACAEFFVDGTRLCLDACTDNADCPPGTSCGSYVTEPDLFVCIPGEDATPRIDDACATAADCDFDGGLCFDDATTFAPAGGICAYECAGDADCPTDETSCEGGFCFIGCDTRSDCNRPAVHACYFGLCLGRCYRDDDCATGRTCNVLSGACVDEIVGAPNGASCVDSAECASGRCTAGLCLSLCTQGGPDGCPAGQSCASVFDDGTRGCLPSCDDQADCAPFLNTLCDAFLDEPGLFVCIPQG